MISQQANDAITKEIKKVLLSDTLGKLYKVICDPIVRDYEGMETVLEENTIPRIGEFLNSITKDSERHSETSGLEEIGFCMTCAFFHWKPDWGNLGKCGRVEETPPVCQGLSCEEYEMHSEYENFFDEKGYPLPSPPKESE